MLLRKSESSFRQKELKKFVDSQASWKCFTASRCVFLVHRREIKEGAMHSSYRNTSEG